MTDVDLARSRFDYDPKTGVIRYSQNELNKYHKGLVAGGLCNKGYWRVWFKGGTIKKPVPLFAPKEPT